MYYDRPYWYSRFWTGTSLQPRLLRGVFSNANDINLFSMLFPCMCLHCTLVPVHYREHNDLFDDCLFACLLVCLHMFLHVTRFLHNCLLVCSNVSLPCLFYCIIYYSFTYSLPAPFQEEANLHSENKTTSGIFTTTK